MKRLGKKLFFNFLASVAAASLAACGGGSHSALPLAGPIANGAQYNGPLADATFKITIPPPPKTSGKQRAPQYVSSSTSKIVFTLNTASRLTAGQVTSFNTSSLGAMAVTLNSPTCPGTGPWTCTLTIKLPPGTDNITVSAEDSSNHVLSQQIQSFTVVVATANSFSLVLDANVNVMTVNGSGSCQNGPVGSVFGSVGTTPVTFTVSNTDLANKTIIGPGLPKIEIQDNTATYQAASGTINGTGGTVSFTINQAAQSFTLTPSNSSTTNASINVKEIPPNSNGGSDGLSFAPTKSFAFSTGVAPPSHNFLAVVEQTGANSGQVDLFNVNSTDQSSLSAFSPATLPVTNSTNENKPDVDNPLSLVWDNTGDLLIGNSHDGSANGGDMACIPVGAISTGANTSTTVSSNVTVPVAIAYDSRDGSVALADNTISATYALSEYLLTGNYTAAAPPRDLTETGLGDHWAVDIPVTTLNAGTYAAAITDGGEVDPAHGGPHTSKITIFSPNGTATDVTCGGSCTGTTYAIDNPTSLAWDNTNNQLVIANGSIFHKQLSFYTISGAGNSPVAVQTKVIAVPSKQFVVATSPDGHVAVQYNSPAGSGYPLVQVYDNTAARNPVGGPIPYNNTTDAGTCSNYVYGSIGAPIVRSLTWLSNSKLMVALEDTNAGFTAQNGLHIYDITNLTVPTGYDDKNCAAYSAAPTQTSSTQITNRPLGTAFKP